MEMCNWNSGSVALRASPIVYIFVRNAVVEKGQWKLQDIVPETNTKEATNDQ
jgi:hypothetical protein